VRPDNGGQEHGPGEPVLIGADVAAACCACPRPWIAIPVIHGRDSAVVELMCQRVILPPAADAPVDSRGAGGQVAVCGQPGIVGAIGMVVVVVRIGNIEVIGMASCKEGMRPEQVIVHVDR